MGEVSTIGLDIAKSVFQIHGVDAAGAVVIRKRVTRAKLLEFFAALPACLVGIEACPTGHYWSRQLQALGHNVRLLPPSYVKAYLKRSKNDANDAAAICEAVTRPSMRFVPTKSEQQQSGLMLHRSRQLLVCQRTMLSNAIRGHLAEFGVISAKKVDGWRKSLVLARSSPPRWWPRWEIGRRSRRAAVSLRGSAWCPDSTRAGAKSGSAGSRSRAIDTCAGCSSPAPWLSSDMRGSTARSGLGSRA
jgi:transposase